MSELSRLAAILAAGAVAIVPACSTDSGESSQDQVESSNAGGSSDETPDAPAGDEPVDGPAEGSVQMTDVATGESTDLEAALASEDGKPVLAWFWAPFCPTCRGEAPELDAFMADNTDHVKMVGIGTRNDIEQAEGFLEDTGVTNFPLLWEPSGQSWVDNAVAAQPYMILIVDGEDVERWPGGASVRQIEDALAAHS
jgi:thiol-disulfide isomerase/thioredoxin